MIDSITFWVFLLVWPIWLVWELALLYWRATGTSHPQTISMVARDLGWKLSGLVYLWAGCAAHWWWNGPLLPTLVLQVVFGVLFWALAAVLFVQDYWLRYLDREFWSPFLRFQRNPLTVMVVGALCGRFLFPQVGV